MMRIVREPIRRAELQEIAGELFGDMVKGVIDIQRQVIALGGELHADEEAMLLEDGSRQQDLWGVNLYSSLEGNEMVEFDSMINVRPSLGNRSRSVEDAAIRTRIIQIVTKLIKE